MSDTTSKMNAGIFSSRTEEWATPQYVFDALNAEFRFTLDVCATHENAKCERHFTKEENGLVQSWDGVCWMNPPYGRDIRRWMQKARAESMKFRGPIVVCLVHARTDTKWWHESVMPTAAEVRFIEGRLRFGDGKNGAPFPSCVVVFNQDSEGLKVSSLRIEPPKGAQ
jgi:phage N-6-adenine-methyltransferase